MAHSSYLTAMTFLKQHLRLQRLSYADLGKRLGVPETTLKKWFRAKEGSFQRLERVCQALALPLSELMREMEQESVLTVKMSDKQQAYFLENRLAFRVYWLLVYERKTTAEISAFLGVKLPELGKILLRLDRLGLVNLHPEDRLAVPVPRPVRWSREGAFMGGIYKEWSEEILRECLAEHSRHTLVLQYFQLTEDSLAELRGDLSSLEEKYARRTIQEMRRAAGTKKIRFLLAAAEGEFVRAPNKNARDFLA